jgi:hypothetical protein
MKNRKKLALVVAAALLLLISIALYWKTAPTGEDSSAAGVAGHAAAPATGSATQTVDGVDGGQHLDKPRQDEQQPNEALADESSSDATERGARGASKQASAMSTSQRDGKRDQQAGKEKENQNAGTATRDAASAEPERVITTPRGGVVVQFRDATGNSYQLMNVVCIIDGKKVASKQGGALAQTGTTKLFDGRLSVADHTVAVIAEYRGYGGGVFSYVEGYRFKVESRRTLSVAADGSTQVVVTTVERGGPTVPLEQRLAMGVSVR